MDGLQLVDATLKSENWTQLREEVYQIEGRAHMAYDQSWDSHFESDDTAIVRFFNTFPYTHYREDADSKKTGSRRMIKLGGTRYRVTQKRTLAAELGIFTKKDTDAAATLMEWISVEDRLEGVPMKDKYAFAEWKMIVDELPTAQRDMQRVVEPQLLDKATIFDRLVDQHTAMRNAHVTGEIVAFLSETLAGELQKSERYSRDTDKGQMDQAYARRFPGINGMIVVIVPVDRFPTNTHGIIVNKGISKWVDRISRVKTHEEPPGTFGDQADFLENYDLFVNAKRRQGIRYLATA